MADDLELRGLDATGGKYAVCCMTHHTVVIANSLRRARDILKHPDFCEECNGS